MFKSFLHKLNRWIFRAIVLFLIYFVLVHAYFGARVLLDKRPGSTNNGDAHYLIDSTFVNETNGKVVQFIGMQHIASDEFYKEVNSLLTSKTESVVFAEGIDLDAFDYKNKKGTREYAIASALRDIIIDGYSELAKKEDLKLQSDKLTLPRFPEEADMPFTQLVERCAASFNCTIGATAMRSRESKLRVYFFYPIALVSFMDFLIDARNEHLMKKVLAESAPNYILLPWGAAHFDGIREALVHAGYKETVRTWHKACEKCS